MKRSRIKYFHEGSCPDYRTGGAGCPPRPEVSSDIESDFTEDESDIMVDEESLEERTVSVFDLSLQLYAPTSNKITARTVILEKRLCLG